MKQQPGSICASGEGESATKIGVPAARGASGACTIVVLTLGLPLLVKRSANESVLTPMSPNSGIGNAICGASTCNENIRPVSERRSAAAISDVKFAASDEYFFRK